MNDENSRMCIGIVGVRVRGSSDPNDPEKPSKPPGPGGPDEQIDVKTRPVTQVPRRFKVIFHNDDYTTMEFVVFILQSVFNHPEAEATQIMLHVHQKGIGVAGVYPHEIAETRVAQVDRLAREHEYPLRCSVEEA
jgi:ATP-dependent Clp protease adaptor protein ClpS